MFRKHPAVIKAWLEHGKDFYCPVQSKLLDDAADMLRPGGTLLYSTCTYNRNENENQIAAFLDRHPDFSVDPIPATHGLTGSAFLPGTVRLFPHKARAEGHFVARLKKSGEAQPIGTANTVFSEKKKRSCCDSCSRRSTSFFPPPPGSRILYASSCRVTIFCSCRKLLSCGRRSAICGRGSYSGRFLTADSNLLRRSPCTFAPKTLKIRFPIRRMILPCSAISAAKRWKQRTAAAGSVCSVSTVIRSVLSSRINSATKISTCRDGGCSDDFDAGR